jgi:transcription antitermination factor NusG
LVFLFFRSSLLDKIESFLVSLSKCITCWKNIEELSNIHDQVKVIHGPLEGTEGKIVTIDKASGVVKVETIFFGRSTSVEVDFSEIEKI